jgi:hypothetical protein
MCTGCSGPAAPAGFPSLPSGSFAPYFWPRNSYQPPLYTHHRPSLHWNLALTVSVASQAGRLTSLPLFGWPPASPSSTDRGGPCPSFPSPSLASPPSEVRACRAAREGRTEKDVVAVRGELAHFEEAEEVVVLGGREGGREGGEEGGEGEGECDGAATPPPLPIPSFLRPFGATSGSVSTCEVPPSPPLPFPQAVHLARPTSPPVTPHRVCLAGKKNISRSFFWALHDRPSLVRTRRPSPVRACRRTRSPGTAPPRAWAGKGRSGGGKNGRLEEGSEGGPRRDIFARRWEVEKGKREVDKGVWVGLEWT